MDWLSIVQFLGGLGAIWFFTVYTCSRFPTLKGKKILMLIAHPDDEAMFFGPTIRSLTRPELGNQIIILCFSSGDADGLGHVRKDELKKSALQLGIASAEHVVIIEDDRFPDSMTKHWDAKEIANILLKNFAPKLASTPTNESPKAYIDVIITFDSKGVSGHPNHISLYHGANAFLKALMQRHTGWDCPTKLYALTTTNIIRKYASFLDAVFSVFTLLFRQLDKGTFPTPLMIVSGPQDAFRAQRAMTTAHRSQMRWFRWGWVGLSRYMIINDLTKQRGPGETKESFVAQLRTATLRYHGS